MTIARIILPLVCSVPILLGCATPANAPQKDAALAVQPLLRIGHSSSTALDFYQLGRYYQGQNRLEQAADAYRKALENHKDYIEAHNALGTVYSSQGKLNEAIAEFESILKTAPQLAHLYNNLGYTYYLQNNFGSAIAAYDKAIALNPRNPRTYNNLGAAYLRIGDAEKSRLAYLRATELRQNDAIASNPSAPLAASSGDGATSTSVFLKNDAPSIDLQPQLASTSLEARPEATALATTIDPGITLALMSATESSRGSLTLSPVRMPAEQNDILDFSSEVYEQDIGDMAFGVLPQLAVPAQLIDPAFKNESALAVPKVPDGVARENKTYRLEIANGNGVTGLARKVSGTLVQQGLPASHLTNLKPYRTLETTIQYRSSFRDEALRLSQKLTTPARLVSNDHLRNTADVRLVLGKDVISNVALFRSNLVSVKLAKKVAPVLGEKS